MASVNGLHAIDEPSINTTHLGKRKRSASSESNQDAPTQAVQTSTQQDLEDALAIIQQHNVPEVLNHVLPSLPDSSLPATKRRRTQSTGPHDTISSRIQNHVYTSYEQFMQDLTVVKKSLTPKVNGHDGSDSQKDDARFDKIWDLLQKEEKRRDNTQRQYPNPASSKMILLSLRGQTDGGVKQLFTGLPEGSTVPSDVDCKRLPNGFEIIEAALIDPSNTKSREKRTFGEVFAPHKNLKPLDPPRSYRPKTNTLEFVPPMATLGMNNKQDYRTMPLTTGFWTRYATSGPKQPNAPVGETEKHNDKVDSAFKSAFSSFGPARDDGHSMITADDRAQRWYRGNQLMRAPLEDTNVTAEEVAVEEELDENFEDLIANFVAESDVDGRDEGEKLLDEVSDLLQTLSSYQTNRDAESVRTPGSATTLPQPEIDTYELLKMQLKLLVDHLPPHAVAKLNGEQLGALNIIPAVPISVPDFKGTTQPDDYTLRRQRAVQATANVASRPAPSINPRPTYGTPAAAYNSQAQTYNQGVVGTPYAPRSSTYVPPRPAVTPAAPYTQPPYRPTPAAYTTPAAQQYQQPGVPKYNQTYTPRASQPGYQQRAQERGSAWVRPDSPHKPMVNGQAQPQFPVRPYTNTAPTQPTSLSTPTPGIPSKTVQQTPGLVEGSTT